MYGGVESIRIHPKLMWTPDLLMYNRLLSGYGFDGFDPMQSHYQKCNICNQRGREVWWDLPNKCGCEPRWQLPLRPPRPLQVHLQDRHHLVPLRRPAVRPQVWLLDLLWLAGYEHRHAIFASEVFFSFVKYWQTHWNCYGLACIEVQHYSVSTISSSFQFLEHFVTFCVIKLSSFKIPHFYLSALVVDEGANISAETSSL